MKLHCAGQRLWEPVEDVIFFATGWIFYAVAFFVIAVYMAMRKAFNR